MLVFITDYNNMLVYNSWVFWYLYGA